jgi:hypothetical protein
VTAIAGGVHLEAPGGDRDVALGGRRGADAARLVALAASDLLSPEPSAAPPPEPEPAAPAIAPPPPTPPTPVAHPKPMRTVATAAPAATTTLTASTQLAPPTTTDGTAFAFYAGVAGWDNAIGGLAAELDVPVSMWLVAIDLGGGASIGGPVQLVETEARAGIGRRIGPLEARLDAIVEPLIVTTGAGDFTALFGGGASVRVRGAVGGAHVIAAAGIDVFANQTEYRTAGADALTTPRMAPWLRVGVEVPL